MTTTILTECPACGANRPLLCQMITEPPDNDGLESENHAYARYIIGNCAECRKWIEGRG